MHWFRLSIFSYSTIVALFLSINALSGESKRTLGNASSPQANEEELSQATMPSDVLQFAERWQLAQEQKNKAAYDSFYGKHFLGTLEQEKNAKKFDKTAWLKRSEDEMFSGATKILINLDHPIFYKSSSSEGIHYEIRSWNRFIRTDQIVVWERINLTILQQGEQFSIIEETVDRYQVEDIIPGKIRERFMHVFPGSVYPILSFAPDPGWGEGKIWSQQGLLLQKIRAGSLPSSLSQFIGKKLRLWDKTQFSCEATIVDLELGKPLPYKRYGGMRIYERVTPPEKALRAQEAKQQFDWQAFDGERHPPDGLLVMARLDVSASCGQPMWAQMANVPRPDFVLPVSADGRLKQQALKLFRHLPQYQEIQQNFHEGFYDQTEYVRPKARYWDTYRRKFLNVSLFQFPTTDVGYVIVQAENGDDPGCMTGNYPHWTLSALWKIKRVGTLVKFEFLRYLSGTTAESSEALTNMDGLEQAAILVSHGMLHRLRGNTLEEDMYPLAPELPECMN